MYNTPPSRLSRSSSSSSLTTPSTPTNNRSNVIESRRRALASGGIGMGKDRGTPVGRLLASEMGLKGIKSPRKVKVRGWNEKIKDYPSNLLLRIETSISLLEFDTLGYPIGILLNLIHFFSRFSIFTIKLSNHFKNYTTSSKKHFGSNGDAEARLEYLRKKTSESESGWKLATILSLLLVLISISNTVYLYTRKRRYHLLLRQDPLSSPNARSTTLNFTPPPQFKPTYFKQFKSFLSNYFFNSNSINNNNNDDIQLIQELNVWTPDYFKWSLKLFTLYSPPISLMYHFLTPSNFFPLVICGSLLVLQNFILITSFSQLLLDRATLQAEVMKEYNSKFVHPRIFVLKRDMGTSTNEAEFVGFNSNNSSWNRNDYNGGNGNGNDRRRSEIGNSSAGRSRRLIAFGENESEEEDEEEDEEEEEEDGDDDEEEEEKNQPDYSKAAQVERSRKQFDLLEKVRKQNKSTSTNKRKESVGVGTSSPNISASGRKRR